MAGFARNPRKSADLVDFLRDQRLSLRTGFGLVSFGSLTDSGRSDTSDDTPACDPRPKSAYDTFL
jgi:hypothetical protein